MSLPDRIGRDLLLQAMKDLDAGVEQPFAASRHYDVLFEGRRYAPKAVVGRAALLLDGGQRIPDDFSAGIGTKYDLRGYLDVSIQVERVGPERE